MSIIMTKKLIFVHLCIFLSMYTALKFFLNTDIAKTQLKPLKYCGKKKLMYMNLQNSYIISIKVFFYVL